MGYYINKNSKGEMLPALGKSMALIHDGAKRISEPDRFIDGLVCVVDNGLFEAAGFVFDDQELQDWLYPDSRRKVWLIYPEAAELSGYNADIKQFGKVR